MNGCMAAAFEWADSYDTKVCVLRGWGSSSAGLTGCIGLEQVEQVYRTYIEGTKAE